MQAPMFCAEGDVKDVLGRDLTSSELTRWKPIAAKATALFQRESGQTFLPGRSTVELQVVGEQVYLMQRPATEIHSVTDSNGDPVTFRRHLGQRLDVPDLPTSAMVTVDYSHGSEQIPALVTLTIAEIVMKVLTIDPGAAAGRVQYSRTAGPYTEMATYATWAQGGQTMLSPADAAIARSYRAQAPRVHVMRP